MSAGQANQEQRRQDALKRRQKLLERQDHLVEIMCKGQHFQRFTLTGVSDIFIWCELSPPRLFWEPADSTAPTQARNATVGNCLYLSSLSDINVSQPHGVFEAHGIAGTALSLCCSFSLVSDPHKIPDCPSGYAPVPLFLKAKDRLLLEVLVIALQKLVGDAAAGTDTGTAAASSTSQQSAPAVAEIVVPQIELFHHISPKQVVRGLLKDSAELTAIDPLQFLDVLLYRGIPFTLCDPTKNFKTQQTHLFFYPDTAKGLIYWGQFKKPSGTIKLHEVNDLLCGRNPQLPAFEAYDQLNCITLTSTSYPAHAGSAETPQSTTLVMLDGNRYDFNVVIFVIHRLLCHDSTRVGMQTKFAKLINAAPVAAAAATPAQASISATARETGVATPPIAAKVTTAAPVADIPEPTSTTADATPDTSISAKSIAIDSRITSLPDHMAWLITQFTSLSLDTTTPLTTRPEHLNSAQLTESDQDDVDSFVLHLQNQTQIHRESARQALQAVPTTPGSSNKVQSDPDGSLLSDLILNTSGLGTETATVGGGDGYMSPVRRKVVDSRNASRLMLSENEKLKTTVNQDRPGYETIIRTQQQQIDQLQAQLVLLQHQQEDQRRLASEAAANRLESLEMNFKLMAEPSTPSKTAASIERLQESIKKAQDSQATVRATLTTLDSQSPKPVPFHLDGEEPDVPTLFSTEVQESLRLLLAESGQRTALDSPSSPEESGDVRLVFDTQHGLVDVSGALNTTSPRADPTTVSENVNAKLSALRAASAQTYLPTSTRISSGPVVRASGAVNIALRTSTGARSGTTTVAGSPVPSRTSSAVSTSEPQPTRAQLGQRSASGRTSAGVTFVATQPVNGAATAARSGAASSRAVGTPRPTGAAAASAAGTGVSGAPRLGQAASGIQQRANATSATGVPAAGASRTTATTRQPVGGSGPSFAQPTSRTATGSARPTAAPTASRTTATAGTKK